MPFAAALIAVQAQAQPGKAPDSMASAAAVVMAPGADKVKGVNPIGAGLLWTELTAAQKISLKPLEAHWNNLSEPQKRKWIELSRSYASLSPAEQHTLHDRMTEWATLSGRQRSLARLNFAEVKQLAPNDPTAKWAAYQALSDDDRRKLADNATVRPKSAAVPVRPVSAEKLVQVPPPPSKGAYGARIQLAPAPAVMRRVSPETPQTEAAAADSVIAPAGATTPALVTHPTPPTPLKASAVPMIRLTEQPSSAP